MDMKCERAWRSRVRILEQTHGIAMACGRSSNVPADTVDPGIGRRINCPAASAESRRVGRRTRDMTGGK